MNTISDFSISRQNNFDFIRFILASAVVFSHSYPIATGTNETEPVSILTHNQNTIGGMAVCAFFIISGFLITQSFSKSRSLSHYMRSRTLRIFPALALVILSCVFLLGPIETGINITTYFTSSVTYQYLWNILTYTKYSTLPGVFTGNPFQNTVNGSLWSLPYEILFYIAVPAVGLFILKKPWPALGFLVLMIALTCSGFLVTDYLPEMTNYFLCGSLYYIFRKKVPLNLWLAVLSVLLLALSVELNIFNYTLGIFGGYVLLFIALKLNFGAHDFARNGDFSYGIYIWAFPIQQIIVSTTSSKSPMHVFLLSFPFILAVAVLSWHGIEKRSLAFKTRLTREKVL